MKVTDLGELEELASKAKSENKKVGLVVGSFDILHMGHLNLFRLAKEYVDFLIVGIDHDETIRQKRVPCEFSLKLCSVGKDEEYDTFRELIIS